MLSLPDTSVEAAIERKRLEGRAGSANEHLVARGYGWSLVETICSCGPADRAFEELHPNTSVSFVLQGSFVYRRDRHQALLVPGSILLGSERAAFQCSHDHGEGDRCISFQYEDEFVDQVIAEAGGNRGFAAAVLPPSRDLSPLFTRCANADTAYVDLEALAFEVLTTARLKAGEARYPHPISFAGEQRVSEIARWLADHYADHISLEQLALRAGLGRFQFLRLFKRATGVTPHQYVLRLRLRAAAKRLAASGETITEIAYGVGFEDLSNFIRSFSSEFGVSPSRFRAARS